MCKINEKDYFETRLLGRSLVNKLGVGMHIMECSSDLQCGGPSLKTEQSYLLKTYILMNQKKSSTQQ